MLECIDEIALEKNADLIIKIYNNVIFELNPYSIYKIPATFDNAHIDICNTLIKLGYKNHIENMLPIINVYASIQSEFIYV